MQISHVTTPLSDDLSAVALCHAHWARPFPVGGN